MFFDDVGTFFTHTLPNAVEDIGRTIYGGTKDAVNTVWNGTISGINRTADILERGANKTIDVGAGFGNLLGNPLLVGGGIILALIVLSKV